MSGFQIARRERILIELNVVSLAQYIARRRRYLPHVLRLAKDMPTPLLEEVLFRPLFDGYEFFERPEGRRVHVSDIHEGGCEVLRLNALGEVEPVLFLASRLASSIPIATASFRCSSRVVPMSSWTRL